MLEKAPPWAQKAFDALKKYEDFKPAVGVDNFEKEAELKEPIREAINEISDKKLATLFREAFGALCEYQLSVRNLKNARPGEANASMADVAGNSEKKRQVCKEYSTTGAIFTEKEKKYKACQETLWNELASRFPNTFFSSYQEIAQCFTGPRSNICTSMSTSYWLRIFFRWSSGFQYLNLKN